MQSVLHALLSRSPVSFAQVQKAKRHEQRVAVCVVRAASGGGGDGGGHNYLLVKRAEKGLLAGDGRADAWL